MSRTLCLAGLTWAAVHSTVLAFDDGGYQYKFSPYTPGTQNQGSNWNSGGNSNWNSGGGGNWNNDWSGGTQHWHQQPQRQYHYDYQPQQSWSYQQPQYTPPQPVYSGLPIKISMPPTEAGLCAYVLTSGGETWNYTIAPGKSQLFNEDRAWQVTYDRGDGYGPQTYGLKPGHYRFRQSSRGWELYRSDSMQDAPPSFAPPPPM